MRKKKTLKKYQKPKIIYEKEIETLAAVCDSAWGDIGLTCRDAGPTCLHLLS